MRKAGKATKTEIFLLGLTVLFFLVVLLVMFSFSGENRGFTIATQRQAETIETIAPRIDLNTATQQQLEQLDGIGPVLAQRIIDYRQACGGFTDVEQLLEVDGIGEKILDSIRDMVTIEEVP